MTREGSLLKEYSLGKSVLKGAGAAAQTVGATVATFLVALASQPEMAERLAELVAGYPKLAALVPMLVFVGRVLLDWRRHKDLGK